MKSVLTLVADADFSGFRSAKQELQVRLPGLLAVRLVQETRERFIAEWKSGAALMSIHDRKPIRGPLRRVKAQVCDRFDHQLSPWKWSRNGVAVEPPEEA